MKKWLKILPFFIVERLAKKFASVDTLSDGSEWYRLFESKKPLEGAGIIMRKTNKKRYEI